MEAAVSLNVDVVIPEVHLVPDRSGSKCSSDSGDSCNTRTFIYFAQKAINLPIQLVTDEKVFLNPHTINN